MSTSETPPSAPGRAPAAEHAAGGPGAPGAGAGGVAPVASVTAPTTIARNVTTELTATTLVMLAGPGSLVLSDGRVGTLGAALAFGVATAIAIGVIGALANPMFTLAMLLVREISLREAVGDWVGQVAGGFLGGALLLGIDDLTRSSAGANGWDRSGFAGLGSVMAAELVFGIVIVVVLLSAVSRDLTTGAIAGFTGAAVAVAHLVLLGVDGAGLNPARSIGSALFADTSPSAIGQVWAFVVVPLVAAVAAVFVWLAIDDAEVDDTVFDGTVLDDLADRLD